MNYSGTLTEVDDVVQELSKFPGANDSGQVS